MPNLRNIITLPLELPCVQATSLRHFYSTINVTNITVSA